MNKKSPEIELANVRASPARDASIRGFRTATTAVTPNMALEMMLNRMDNHRLTMKNISLRVFDSSATYHPTSSRMG